jgi:hypothetical protein
MDFQFISNEAIDHKARKLIRSHVAKGRNIGKGRSSRRKQCQLGVQLPEPIPNPRVLKDIQDLRRKESIPVIELQVGDGLSVLSLPAELTPAFKSLFKNGRALSDRVEYILDAFANWYAAFSFISRPLYPPEISDRVNFAGVSRMWIQYIFTDKACMNFMHQTFSTNMLTLYRFALRYCSVRCSHQSPCFKTRRVHSSDASPVIHPSSGQ